jgi:thiamine biosynthesis lipoprotein
MIATAWDRNRTSLIRQALEARLSVCLYAAFALLIFPCAPGISYARVPPSQVSSELYLISHPAMGTVYSLYIYAGSRAEADAEAEPVFQEIDRLDELLSNYRESSELSRINRHAATSTLTTDPETFRFLRSSLAWSARSHGAFDITVGKLMKAWGFVAAKGHIPGEAELAQVRNEVGWQKVQLKSAQRTVRFLSPGVELDPGGIGKGYAVDRAVEILRAENVASALLSAGSSTIYALGRPPGQPGWKVQVPVPESTDKILSTVILRNTSLSTANCSEKHFINSGHVYCHIMDPHTLHPVEGMLQVSVISPSATDSDALSNVLFVLGSNADVSMLRRLPGDSALVISGDIHSARCETIRWPVSIRSGLCSIATAREN